MSCLTDVQEDHTQNADNSTNNNETEITTDLLLHLPPLSIPLLNEFQGNNQNDCNDKLLSAISSLNNKEDMEDVIMMTE
eukprot:15362353-Ditylum_brightwellii.AAC.1